MPSVRDVVKALKTLSVEKTRNLVFHLGVPPNAMDDIEKEYSGDTRKQKFIEKWLDTDTNASWEKVVSALREIDMLVLAAEVQSEMLSSFNVSAPHFEQPISVPVQLKVTPLNSTPAALSPASSQVLSVNGARVAEVRASIEYFEELFTDLTVDVELELVIKEDQDYFFFKRLRSYLLALPAAKKGIHVSFFRNNEKVILETKEVEKIFPILNRYCNYSNYEIIVVVVKKFCGEPLQRRMLTYRDSHIEFEKSTTVDIYLCAISAPPESDIFIGFTKMAMKINKPSNICTLYEIRQLKESIARNASLHSYSVYIEAPQEGSVRVILRFPEECGWLVGGVMTAEFMETHQLTDVTVDGEDLKYYLVGQSAITDAVWTEVVHQLLVASVVLQDEGGWSALLWAAYRGHSEVVTLLLEAGANADLQAADGWSALMLAAYRDNVEVIAQLLEAGANADLQSTKHGVSALMVAAYKGRSEIAAQLLEAGANTDLQNKRGVSALTYAARRGYTEVVTQLLVAGANTDLQSTKGEVSALIWAAYKGHSDVVAQLLEAGANPDLLSKEGDTAVIHATLHCHSDSLRQLVRAGADLNLSNKEGLTALVISSRNGTRDITDILLSSNDINIDTQTGNGWSALFFSAEKGDLLTTQSLLKAGATPHLKDQNGLTALDIANSAASDGEVPGHGDGDGDVDYDGVCELLHHHMLESAGVVTVQGLSTLVSDSREKASSLFDQLQERTCISSASKKHLQETSLLVEHEAYERDAIITLPDDDFFIHTY